MLRTRGLKGRDFTGLDHQNATLTGLGVVSFGFPGLYPYILRASIFSENG